MDGVEWALLIGLSILWGGSFYFIEVALVELRPFTIVFGRVFLAAIIMYLILKLFNHSLPTDRQQWKAFFMIGILNNIIPYSLIVWGQTQIEGGLASILNATTPVWGIILAHYFTGDERLTSNRLAGVILGLVGVVVMIGFDVLQGLGANVLAQLAIVLAALSYAVAGIYSKRFRDTPPLVTSTGQVMTSALMMLPLVLIVDRPWQYAMPTLSTWAALLSMTILSTVIAYLIYFRLLKTAGATNSLLVTFLIPVSALLLGILLLDERLTGYQIWGMVLIGAGLLAIDGRILHLRWRAHRHQQQ